MKAQTRNGLWLLLLAVGGCIGFGGPRAALDPRAERMVQMPPRPEAEVKGDGPRTLAYWKRVGEIINKEREIRSPQRPSLQEGVCFVVKRQVTEIQELPVLEVDRDVLDLTGRLVDLFRQTAAGIQAVRWYHGLGWPLPLELAQLDPKARALRRDMEELRIVLARRYGLDFPLLDFPGGYDKP